MVWWNQKNVLFTSTLEAKRTRQKILLLCVSVALFKLTGNGTGQSRGGPSMEATKLTTMGRGYMSLGRWRNWTNSDWGGFRIKERSEMLGMISSTVFEGRWNIEGFFNRCNVCYVSRVSWSAYLHVNTCPCIGQRQYLGGGDRQCLRAGWRLEWRYGCGCRRDIEKQKLNKEYYGWCQGERAVGVGEVNSR